MLKFSDNCSQAVKFKPRSNFHWLTTQVKFEFREECIRRIRLLDAQSESQHVPHRYCTLVSKLSWLQIWLLLLHGHVFIHSTDFLKSP